MEVSFCEFENSNSGRGGSRNESVRENQRYVDQVGDANKLRIRHLTIALPARAFAAAAAGGALPWDQPLTTLQTDLQGPVAHSITTAAIIGAGLTWAFSEHGTGARKMSALAFGGAAALGATQLMTAVFPFAGALF